MSNDNADSPAPISGIILAGGFGRRLGGDKAAALAGGRPLLHWTAHALASIVDDLVIVARFGQTTLPPRPVGLLPEEHSWRVVHDARTDSGPLAGIEAGLAAIRHDRALVVATDMPLLRPALLRALVRYATDPDSSDPATSDSGAAGEPGEPATPGPAVPDVTMPIREGRAEPLLAVYRRACLPVVTAMLDGDERRPRMLLRRVPGRRIEVDRLRRYDPNLVSFRNVNTQADLAEVGRLLLATVPIAADATADATADTGADVSAPESAPLPLTAAPNGGPP